jgi:hypothetical protein
VPARTALASLAASLLLICGYFALAAPVFDFDGDRQRYVLLAAALALPYAGAAGLLLCARRSLGLALAVGIGGVASVMLGPVIAVLVLFAGFASSTQQLQSIGLAALFAPVQLLLTFTALRAHRALPAAEKRPGAFGIGVAAPLAYGFILATAMQWQVYDAKSGERADAAAHRAVHEIVRCAWAWTNAHPARGFPPDLAALGPAGSGCLDAQTVRGELAARLRAGLGQGTAARKALSRHWRRSSRRPSARRWRTRSGARLLSWRAGGGDEGRRSRVRCRGRAPHLPTRDAGRRWHRA